MLKNHLKIAYRSMMRRKGYSVITVAGLAVGMASAILIGMWIQGELSFDRFHEEADRICRLSLDMDIAGQVVRVPLSNPMSAPAIARDFPEVVDAVRFWIADMSVQYERQEFRDMHVWFADSSVFNVFSFPLLRGDPTKALTEAYTAVVTESTARRIFGNDDPMGQSLLIAGDHEYTITGVAADVPSNSHLQFDILRSYRTRQIETPWALEQWNNFDNFTYLLLAEGADYRDVEAKLPAIVQDFAGDTPARLGGRIDLFLQPLTDIYLFSDLEYEPQKGSIRNVYLFGVLGLLALIIAGINFVNLITARAVTRAKEVGLRKTLGAPRGSLVRQFLGESLVYALVSLVAAVVLVEALAPFFGGIAGRDISLRLLSNPWAVPALLLLAVFFGVGAGAYPALYLSRFRPAHAVKGEADSGPRGTSLRRVLVLIQLTASVALIVATVVAQRQLAYMRKSHLGYDEKRVVVIPGLIGLARERVDVLKTELGRLTAVASLTTATAVPGSGSRIESLVPEGFTNEAPQGLSAIIKGGAFVATMGLTIVAGRDFSEELSSDSMAILVNETAVRQFGWTEPIGKTIARPAAGDSTRPGRLYHVIGVVKDFHFSSLHWLVTPMIIRQDPSDYEMLCLRLAPGNVHDQLQQIKDTWTALCPERACDYQFLGDPVEDMYAGERRLSQIMSSLSALALFIAAMGLVGLSAHAAERRTREIGIRKVLGSTVPGIVTLLSKELLILVLISNAVAAPVMVWAVDKWLATFAYKAQMGWPVYAAAGGAVLLVALLAVSYQSIRAALANPVKSIRYE